MSLSTNYNLVFMLSFNKLNSLHHCLFFMIFMVSLIHDICIGGPIRIDFIILTSFFFSIRAILTMSLISSITNIYSFLTNQQVVVTGLNQNQFSQQSCYNSAYLRDIYTLKLKATLEIQTELQTEISAPTGIKLCSGNWNI